MAFHQIPQLLSSAAITLALLATTGPTWAQPDPFEDFEQGVEAVPVDAPAQPPPVPEAPAGDTKKPAADEAAAYVSGQYRWSLGLGTQFAYTGTTNETLSGDDQINRTFFLTLAPKGGFFVIDQLEVTLAMGLLSKLTAREGNSSVAENNFFFEAGAHYHIPVGKSPFAIVPGLGMGGYFGGSTRTFTIAGAQVDESTSTSGFLLNGYLGAAYQPSPSWRLRSGIAIGGLFGTESIDSQDQALAASAVHVGLPLEISYVF